MIPLIVFLVFLYCACVIRWAYVTKCEPYCDCPDDWQIDMQSLTWIPPEQPLMVFEDDHIYRVLNMCKLSDFPPELLYDSYDTDFRDC